MNHYAKIAVVIIRLVAFLSFLLGLLGIIYGVVAIELLDSSSDERRATAARIASSILFLVVGLVTHLISKPVGRLLGKDLDVG